MNPAAQRGVVTLQGFRHAYAAWLPEEPRHPPVVALHGFGTSGARTFHHVGAAFHVPGIPLYAPDLLGFGTSDKPSDGYSLERYAALIHAFADALQLQAPVLLGHSMGGKLAAAAGALAPKRFSGLVLVCPGGFGPLARLEASLAGRAPVRWLFRQSWFFRGLLPRTPLGPVFAREESRAQFLRLYHEHRALDLAHTGLHARLAAYPQPVLVLWGSRDAVLRPRHGHRVRQAFPESRLHLLDGAGHAPMKDRPLAFTDAVATYLHALQVRPQPSRRSTPATPLA